MFTYQRFINATICTENGCGNPVEYDLGENKKLVLRYVFLEIKLLLYDSI
jgi:hypothetical protein